MKTAYCSICHVEHDICECGLSIWVNPYSGRIFDAHGDGKHFCKEGYWDKLLSKPQAGVRRTAQPEKVVPFKKGESPKPITKPREKMDGELSF